MGDLLRQLPALIGVLVGVSATYLTTSAAERARWRRSQAVRWDEHRLEIYAEYGHAVKRLSWLAARVAAARGFEHMVEPLDPDIGLAELAAAEGERAVRWESVLLVGSPGTIAAARTWHQAVVRLTWFARGRLDSVPEWEQAMRQMERDREEFYIRARQDLSIDTGAAFQAQQLWPPSWLSRSPGSSTS